MAAENRVGRYATQIADCQAIPLLDCAGVSRHDGRVPMLGLVAGPTEDIVAGEGHPAPVDLTVHAASELRLPRHPVAGEGVAPPADHLAVGRSR